MKTNFDYGLPMPTANLAINKSRLKLYNKNSEVPTYYLQKGQEFQIELFNPTNGNILAKISLNGKPIAQGGLVLRPGERVFLDRYIDVARKFKFDTYEVANTSEVRKAIEDNGDFKVEFYNEYIPPVSSNPWIINDLNIYYDGNNTFGNNTLDNTFEGPNIRGIANTSVNYTANLNATPINDTLNLTDLNLDLPKETKPLSRTFKKRSISRTFKKRSISRDTIETGRVEMGSTSNQKMTTVNMNWLTIPFHTVEYKMLPVSQKVNTIEDVQVKRYCTNCGTKQKPSNKFCPSCGTKC